MRTYTTFMHAAVIKSKDVMLLKHSLMKESARSVLGQSFDIFLISDLQEQVFCFQVECCDKDLHSGVFGGSVHEAMTDLIALMGETDVYLSLK